MEITFKNDSVITCGGLDDQERVDKILGQEFATIYVNESQDIPWNTITLILSRLAQKVEFSQNKFIVDLNPTSTAHWTYKIWFKHIHPETLQPLNTEGYGSLQMNPYDNKENLAGNYIKDYLESYVGDRRKRFLLGEYNDNTDLHVFTPNERNFYQWEQFTSWVGTSWQDIAFVGGLDLGFQDADAFVILAYIPGRQDIWMLYERKVRRQDLHQLGKLISEGLDWLDRTIPKTAFDIKNMPIFCDTNTIRHGKEGELKKNWRELRRIFGFNLRAAYKRDKYLGIELLREDVNQGRLHILPNGDFADECENTIWTKNPVDQAIMHVIDDDVYHPDVAFALLYAYRYLTNGQNGATIGMEQSIEPLPLEDQQQIDRQIAEWQQKELQESIYELAMTDEWM